MIWPPVALQSYDFGHQRRYSLMILANRGFAVLSFLPTEALQSYDLSHQEVLQSYDFGHQRCCSLMI